MTALALALFAVALAAAAWAVWRRPVLALYAFVVGLALHNLVMALLFGAGIRGAPLTAIAAWKEALLVVALASVAWSAWRRRELPFRPGAVDALALAFAAVVLVYAALPQAWLGGSAGAEARLHGLRHALLPVAAYALGRGLALGAAELRRLGWTVLGVAAAVAAYGLADAYLVPIEWWRDSGAVGWFRDQLGFDYRGPGRLPENFAFNDDEGVFRRLTSTFLSPLASAFLFAVALLLALAGGPHRRRPALLAATAAVVAAGLLFTISRSAVLALAGGFVVLALARRSWKPLAASAATLAAGAAFALTFTAYAPETRFFPEDLPYQEQRARELGDVPDGTLLDPDEPSLRSHLTSLREGLETVASHPQGFGLGNAGAVARRTDTELLAGESNYTELGVETGIAGLALFLAWALALLAVLVRAGRAGDWAGAWLAAALATVLALGVQTDALGVPWLAYVVWALAGSRVAAVAPRTAAVPSASASRGAARGATP